MSDSDQATALSSPVTKIAWMLSGGIIARLASGISTVVIIYFLEAAEYGELATSLFWSVLISVFAGAGLSDLIVKKRFHETTDTSLQVLHAWVITFVLSALAAGTVYVLLIAPSFSEAGKTLFICCSVAALFAAMAFVAQGGLRAEGHTVSVARLIMITTLLTSLGLIVFAWATGNIRTLGYWYMMGFSVALFAHLIVLKHFNLLRFRAIDVTATRKMLSQSLPFGMVQMLMLSLPILSGSLVLVTFGDDIAGSYNVIIALFLAAGSIATALDQAVYPMLVASSGNRARPATGYISLSLFLSLPAIFLFCIYGPDLVGIAFPDRYSYLDQFIIPLGILIPLRFVNRGLSVMLRLRGMQYVSVTGYIVAIAMLFLATVLSGLWAPYETQPVHHLYFFIGAEVFTFVLMVAFTYSYFDRLSFWVAGQGLAKLLSISMAVVLLARYSDLAAGLAFVLTAFAYLISAYFVKYISQTLTLLQMDKRENKT